MAELQASNETTNKSKFVENIPYRVQAALNYFTAINMRNIFADYKEVTISDEEEATKKHALRCLNHYFNGEFDYGDRPVVNHEHEKIDINETTLKKIDELEKFLKELKEKVNVS